MAKTINMPRLHFAAGLFAEDPTRTVEELATRAGVDGKTIYGWSHRPEWAKALDSLKFTGTRKLASKPKRDMKRDSGDLIDLAKDIYCRARQDGMKKTAANNHTAQVVNKAPRTVAQWRKRFRWDEGIILTKGIS